MLCSASVSAGFPPPPDCAIISFVMSPWHAHLAGHERLHAGLRVGVDEDRASRLHVGRQGDVGAVVVTLAEERAAVAGSHVEQDLVAAVVDLEVHQDIGAGRRAGVVLTDDLRSCVEPCVGKERKLFGHSCLLRSRNGRRAAHRT